MKKQLLFALSLCASCMCGAQSLNPYYYYYEGEKQFLELNADYALVGKSNPMARTVQTEVEKVDLKEVSAPDYSAKINLLKDEEGVNYVAPFFKSQNGGTFGISNYFIVQLKKAEDEAILNSYAKSKGARIVEKSEYLPLCYVLSCENASLNGLECANMFHESGLFEYAEPDFVYSKSAEATSVIPEAMNKAARAVSGTTTIPTNYASQWGLENTGQYGGVPGVDINIPHSNWPPTYFEIIPKVAVVDNGVETSHPALPLMYSYDIPTEKSPNQVYGAQGTAVAGIIGARPISGSEIRGVFPSCALMSYSSPYNAALSTYKFATAISEAAEKGADVINCSWGDDQASANGSMVLKSAINIAATSGRNGLGCVIVCAAGNKDTTLINFPANLENVIAVGAITPKGKRRIPTFRGDWGSNYGDELDIVAPGEMVATTDLSGYDGYNPDGYINDFTDLRFHKFFAGTAAACPFVSGVAAMVISTNPTLPAKRVKQILMNTATKLDGYYFRKLKNETDTIGTGFTTVLPVTHNGDVGSGLVNAYEAEQKAFKGVPFLVQIEGNNMEMTFKINNLPNSGKLHTAWTLTGGKYYIYEMGRETISFYTTTVDPQPAILKCEIYTNKTVKQNGKDVEIRQVLYTTMTGVNTSSTASNTYRVEQNRDNQILKLIKTEKNTEITTTRTAVSDIIINLYSNAALIHSEKALSTDREVALDISRLNTGNYVLNVVSGGKIIFNQSVLIKR